VRIAAAASGGDDKRRQLFLLQVKGMIQASLENRRGYTVVLRRAEYHDGIGPPRLIAHSLMADRPVKPPLCQGRPEQSQNKAKRD
jgi:hypothetical protein